MAEAATKRCFLAIRPDEGAVGDLADWLRPVDVAGLKKVAPEQMHLTLKFLGHVEPERIDALLEAVSEAAQGTGRLELVTTGVAILPHPGKPRVLAAALDCPDALAALFERVENAAEACGFQREGRRFRPHITLGRFKKKPPRQAAEALMEADPPETGFTAAELALVESQLDRHGPTYTDLATFSFTADTA